MEKITYYIGAGASYNSLPLYSNFQERLGVFRDYIFHFFSQNNTAKKEEFKFYLDALNELIKRLDPNETTTVDILAHELYNRGESSGLDFYRLKYLISDFFIFEQLQKPNSSYLTQKKKQGELNDYEVYNEGISKQVSLTIDNRYKPFILPLLNQHDKKFPQEINFISWNYDLQFELAYATARTISIVYAQQELQVYPSPSTQRGISLDRSTLIKLNGTAGIYYKDNKYDRIENFIYERNIKLDESYLLGMIQTFWANRHRIYGAEPLFKFYFENDKGLNTTALNYADSIMKETEVLVVIGYSFHTSNREIDKKALENGNKVKKVVFQLHPNDYDQVKYNFLQIRPDLKDVVTLYPTLSSFPSPNNI